MGFVFTVMIALFGLMYYIIRYLVDSMKSSRAEGEFKKSRDSAAAIMEGWKKATVDVEYERYLWSALEKDGVEAKELIKKADELASGEEWYKKIVHSIVLYQRILMADRGKLLKNDSICPVNSLYYKKMTPQMIYEYESAYSKMYLWIAKRLREHGVDAVPVCVSSNRYWYLNERSEAAPSYIWEPAIPFYVHEKIQGEPLR